MKQKERQNIERKESERERERERASERRRLPFVAQKQLKACVCVCVGRQVDRLVRVREERRQGKGIASASDLPLMQRGSRDVVEGSESKGSEGERVRT